MKNVELALTLKQKKWCHVTIYIIKGSNPHSWSCTIMEDTKRSRKPNWTKTEIASLIEAVSFHQSLIFSKFRGSDCNKKKQLAWNNVADSVRAQNDGVGRTVDEVSSTRFTVVFVKSFSIASFMCHNKIMGWFWWMQGHKLTLRLLDRSSSLKDAVVVDGIIINFSQQGQKWVMAKISISNVMFMTNVVQLRSFAADVHFT